MSDRLNFILLHDTDTIIVIKIHN